VKAIVDYPNAVEVKEVDGERTTVVELRVAKEDVGKVIGKQGRIAEAIRVILGASGAKINGLVAKGRRKSSRSCRPGTLDGEGRLARAGQVARWQYDEGRERPWSEGR
jgi:predicted RNA-binding protein YlqC (UPF0109 family)